MRDFGSAETIQNKLKRHQLWLDTDGDDGEQAEFIGYYFCNVMFPSMKLEKVCFSDCTFYQCEIGDLDISDSEFTDCEFVQNELNSVRAYSCYFQNCEFRFCLISGCGIAFVELVDCILIADRIIDTAFIRNKRNNCYADTSTNVRILMLSKPNAQLRITKKWADYLEKVGIAEDTEYYDSEVD